MSVERTIKALIEETVAEEKRESLYATLEGYDTVEEYREAKTAATETTTDEVPPYDTWSKPELVQEAEARGLATTGTKAELVARLEEDDDAGEA